MSRAHTTTNPTASGPVASELPLAIFLSTIVVLLATTVRADNGGNNYLENARGFGVEAAFGTGAQHSVNTFNGNLVVAIPLGPVF